MKRIGFHDMRHPNATLLLESGLTVVRRRLGHASVKTTADLYVHFTEQLQEAAAESFTAYHSGLSFRDPLAIDGSEAGPEAK